MIVGITGLAGSGKDTLADILVSKHGYVRVSLADPLKRICKEVFDFSDDQLWGPSQRRNEPDTRYPREHSLHGDKCLCCGQQHDYMHEFKTCYLTPRYALQTMGTEWGRNCHGDTWVRYAMRVAKRILDPGVNHPNWVWYTPQTGAQPSGNTTWVKPQGVVIPDVRFLNEMAAIRSGGGKLLRIKRPGFEKPQWNHVRETEQLQKADDYFDSVVLNSGTIEELATGLVLP
jgi:hypothetical protein